MSKEGQPGRDQANAYSREQGGSRKESNANSPRAPLTQEQQSWYDRPHEEMVKGFQVFFEGQHKDARRQVPIEHLISQELSIKWHLPEIVTESDFFGTIKLAWDALAYDRYRPGSHIEEWAGKDLEEHFRSTNEQTIKLSDPQIRVINALTEAVGIPHQRGQAEIEIPENLKHYSEWQVSEEYQERVAKAKSEWKTRHNWKIRNS